MSILSDFEDRVGRAIEGVFSGVFRAPVQPAEIARAAAKEMDRRKRLGVGKVYAPTVYSVLLSPEDAHELGGFTDTLAGELETYLLGHAEERGYELAHRPRVRFLVDDELRLGSFEVIGELLSPEEIAAEMSEAVASTSSAQHGDSRQDLPNDGDAQDAPLLHAPTFGEDVFAPTSDLEPVAAPKASGIATVTVPGTLHDVAITSRRTLIGRLKTCDICLQDANASREHAAIERDESGWMLVDLDSLNGTMVNGHRIERARLKDGDVITVGVTELVFHGPRS